jgi:sulfane dehydrogenase subunit SoxC
MKDRRGFLALTAGLLGSCKVPKPASESGAHMRPYGLRSPREKTARVLRELTASPGTGSSRTPLQDLFGTITPSELHYERHHSGVPDIDPAAHELLIHGLVEQPLTFSMAALRRYPSVSRTCFLECSGNVIGDLRGNPPPTVQDSHGLLSCSEWTGVSLRLVLEEARLKPEAKWLIAEGADASRMARSIPIDKALDDALLVYGQNGEALRPEQGYPLRLILPGFEGNMNVKWLHQLLASDQPAMSVKETANYTELLPSGQAEIFTFVMEARSVITSPSGGQKIASGFNEITGLAWTGMGKITKVEVSTDSGKTWRPAAMQEPILDKSVVRFRFPWEWNGEETVIQSRCTDETGFVQPSRDEFIAKRGVEVGYHYNGIKPWLVKADGNVLAT